MSVYDMNEERDIGQSKVQVLEDRTNPLPLPFPTPKYRPGVFTLFLMKLSSYDEPKWNYLKETFNVNHTYIGWYDLVS